MPPLLTLPPIVFPGVVPPLALPPLVVLEFVSGLRLGDLDRDLLTLLSVACGRWTGGTVNWVIRRFRSAEEATVSTVFVDGAVVALLTGVSESPELELDDDKL